MRTRVITLDQTGAVNQIYGILPDHLCAVDNKTTEAEYNAFRAKNEKAVLDYLRYDNEFELDRVPSTNPSIKSTEVDFRYNPVFYRQAIAAGIPYKITPTITVIDAFACMGTRFGLKSLMVFVEVYKSSCGENRIWANIFYVADSEIPICTIRVDRHVL